EASASSRIELWYGGILLLKANPLFGAGYDRFMEDLPQTAHNSYILAAAELGLFGIFFWIVLIYSSFKGLSMIINTDERLYNYALAVQSSLVGFCAAAFFLSRTYTVLPYLLFALSGSLMYIAKQRNNELDFRFTKHDWKMSGIWTIGILILVYAFIKVGL
ncbi:MAG: O-antigen ligase family protein, partial [Candidatus Omnitrophica bacterium]|nr:O-antigen ligase family protein [Candidatus Omnitrophota bacterium]